MFFTQENNSTISLPSYYSDLWQYITIYTTLLRTTTSKHQAGLKQLIHQENNSQLLMLLYSSYKLLKMWSGFENELRHEKYWLLNSQTFYSHFKSYIPFLVHFVYSAYPMIFIHWHLKDYYFCVDLNNKIPVFFSPRIPPPSLCTVLLINVSKTYYHYVKVSFAFLYQENTPKGNWLCTIMAPKNFPDTWHKVFFPTSFACFNFYDLKCKTCWS